MEVLAKIRGPNHPAIQEWKDLQEFMRPLAKASSMIPPAALRFGEKGAPLEQQLPSSVTAAALLLSKSISSLAGRWQQQLNC